MTTQYMIAIVTLILFLIFPVQTFAIAKFDTAYQIYYKVEDTGNTHVTIVVNQKNNLSVVFATEYGISLGQTNIENIRISDDGKLITPEINKGQNQTTISFPFVNKVVGKDKLHKFSIEYDTTDIVNKSGNTWQVNIPRFETDENISDQTAILTVPNTFPKPAYVDPKPDLINGGTYYFSSKVLANKPISAIFGNNQYYKGQIKYNLENQSNEKIKTEIAIPPNTSYQEVYIENLEPKPESVRKDADGNLLAKYQVEANDKKTINLKIFFKMDFLAKSIGDNMPGDNLKSNKIWDFDHVNFTAPEIKNLKTPKSIYDYVSSKLKYDFQKINRGKNKRVPASAILLNPESAICTDYTDLFVTLARKSGIPAREIEGIAMTDNPNLKPVITSSATDILHAWPEYYDSTNLKWIQVDPTWASTTKGIDYFNKLDFNHLTFVIHGQDPEYPVPAGGYKTLNQKTPDINIEAIEEISFPKVKVNARFTERQKNKLIFELENTSGVYYQGSIKIAEGEYNFGQEDYSIIPPFSTAIISAYLKQNYFGVQSAKVIITSNDQSQELEFRIPALFTKTQIFTGGFFFLGIVAIAARGIFFRRRK